MSNFEQMKKRVLITDLVLSHRLKIHCVKHICALKTCTDMHVEKPEGGEKLYRMAPHMEALKVGPYHGKKWLFWAMDGSPTMDGWTHHGYRINSTRPIKLTQSVLCLCTP